MGFKSLRVCEFDLKCWATGFLLRQRIPASRVQPVSVWRKKTSWGRHTYHRFADPYMWECWPTYAGMLTHICGNADPHLRTVSWSTTMDIDSVCSIFFETENSSQDIQDGDGSKDSKYEATMSEVRFQSPLSSELDPRGILGNKLSDCQRGQTLRYDC